MITSLLSFEKTNVISYTISKLTSAFLVQITIFSSLGGLHCPKIVELLDQGFQLLIRATNLQRDFSPTYGDNLKSTNKTTLHILDKKPLDQNKRAKTNEGRVIVEKQHGKSSPLTPYLIPEIVNGMRIRAPAS